MGPGWVGGGPDHSGTWDGPRAVPEGRAELPTEGLGGSGSLLEMWHWGRGYTCRRRARGTSGGTLRSQTCKGDMSTRTLVQKRGGVGALG